MASGAVVGESEAFLVNVRNVTATQFSALYTWIIELGPERDDTLTLSGSTETTNAGIIADDDGAVTGGINRWVRANKNGALRWPSAPTLPTTSCNNRTQ